MTEEIEELEKIITNKVIKINNILDLVDSIIYLVNFGDIPFLELCQMPVQPKVTLDKECALVRQIRPNNLTDKDIIITKEWFANHLPFWKMRRRNISKFTIGNMSLQEYAVDNYGNPVDFSLTTSEEARQVLIQALDEKASLLRSYMNGLTAISNLLLMGDVPFKEITQMPTFQRMDFEREKNICGEYILLLRNEGKTELSEEEKKNAVAISNIKKMLEQEFGMKNL